MFLKVIPKPLIKLPFHVAWQGKSWLFVAAPGILPSKELDALSVCVEPFPDEYAAALLVKFKGSLAPADEAEVDAMKKILATKITAWSGPETAPTQKLKVTDVLIGTITVEDFDKMRADEAGEFLGESALPLELVRRLHAHVREDRKAPKVLETIEAYIDVREHEGT